MVDLPLTKQGYLRRIKTFQASSESYMSTNLYSRWKKNENIWRLIHENTKLDSDPRYAHRSKLYIPKARNAANRKTAAFIATYFGNADVVKIKPRRKSDPIMEKAAELLFAATNYRLVHSANFFLNCLLAFTDLQKYGRGIVNVDWDYAERSEKEVVPRIVEGENGPEIEKEKLNTFTVVRDELALRHVPIWNLFVAPNANPIDPINSSPCLVEKVPIYVYEAMEKFKSKEWTAPEELSLESEEDDSWGAYVWSPSDFETSVYSSKQNDTETNKLWRQIEVWKCFMNIDGRDVFFLSLKGEHMLTDPEFSEGKWPCEGRPYVMGGVSADPGVVYWQSFLEVVEGLQKEINAIRNQRRDNVTLALNKKILIRRTAGIDLGSLLYSRPGAPVLGDDIGEMAVRELMYQDVTSSSYKEQQENERAFEEVTGITPYNMGTQRPGMNQTATGTSVLTEEANTLIAMEISIVNLTFMKPLLSMIVQFEQAFETESVLRHVANEEGISFDQVWTREAIEGQYDIEIDAGVGATSREIRFRNGGMILDRMIGINAQYGAPVWDVLKFGKDLLPLAGYPNPDKYVNQAVIQLIMSKFGQATGMSLMNPYAQPPRLIGPGNAGGSQIPSMGQGAEGGQGFGGEPQPNRG